MYVTRVPNRGSPPAVLLRESYRQDGKVRNRTLANLSRWPAEKVEALERVLKGLPPKVALAEAFASGHPVGEIVQEKGLAQISDEGALGGIVDEVIAENPGPVEQFRGGKEGVIGFLVGQVMKKTRGQANPGLVNELLKKKLT